MKTISEKALLDLNFTPVVDTTSTTIGAYVTPEAGGASTLLGTVVGGVENTEYTITCDFDGLTVDTVYHLEVIADVTGTNPVVLLPDDNSGRPIRIKIANMQAY